ncbi:duf4419 domain containing protein [Fusarium agapanthi]|uniref:Duf4419 domain containing protein n=1 Tax=Fusarium agapanthi TaxID=1803897 RepID=A0A9P5E708_9HYPO|nr:duf4419 domain containing protein [Fusarium agapanthi]
MGLQVNSCLLQADGLFRGEKEVEPALSENTRFLLGLLSKWKARHVFCISDRVPTQTFFLQSLPQCFSLSHHLIIPVINNAPKQNRTKHFLSFSHLKIISNIAAMAIITVDTTVDDIPRVGGTILEQISKSGSHRSGGVFIFGFLYRSPYMVPCHNGFILAVTEIYDSNPRLTIRADNIWLAILAQLKPWIAGFRKKQKVEKTIDFTTEQLKDSALVAKRLSDRVETEFGDEKKEVLMPHFCTTTPEDTISVALLLLGNSDSKTEHRPLKPEIKAEEPDYATNVIVLGRSEDWDQLRNTFAAISSWGPCRPPLDGMVQRHSKLLLRLLQASLQDYSLVPTLESFPSHPER